MRADQQGLLWRLGLEKWSQECWRMLERAATGIGDPLRYPAVATTGAGGPQLRTVVLRAARPQQRQLLFYTDARSPKVRELRQRPELAWVFFDQSRGLQLRVWGNASLHVDDAVANACWQDCDEPGRRNYSARQAPGTELLATIDRPQDCGAGRENFLVVACLIERMDVLLLGSESHARLDMRWRETGWETTWLSP